MKSSQIIEIKTSRKLHSSGYRMMEVSFNDEILSSSSDVLHIGFKDWLDGFDYSKSERLQDIFTIARNLGFNVDLCDLPKCFGEKCTVLYEKSDKVFMEYRVYKNGNMHVKFDIEFTKAMNVEVSRLLGWIKDKEDIKKEFPTELAKGAEKYFKQNYTCIGSNLKLLELKAG